MKNVTAWVAVATLTACNLAIATPTVSPTATHATFCGTKQRQSNIDAAAAISGLQAMWIEAVVRAESAGCQQTNGRSTTSLAGAMGLMQLMPASWVHLRTRYGLGTDPYNPRDNIIAGAGLLKELYDRYGAAYFIAACHAGPSRVEDELSGARALPTQTREYVARVQRALGSMGAEDLAALLNDSTGTRTPFVRRTHGSDAPNPHAERLDDRSLFVRIPYGLPHSAERDSGANPVQTE